MLRQLLRKPLGAIFRLLYRVEVRGMENIPAEGRAVMISNHVSFLDSVLLAVFLPGDFGFAIDLGHARRWWIKPALWLVTAYPINSLNPLAVRKLIHRVREKNRLMVFPEGRITVTGGLMKAYDGPGMIADKTDSLILPMHIAGAEFSMFSRIAGKGKKLPLRWLPKITITIFPPRKLSPPENLRGRRRRRWLSDRVYDILADSAFAASPINRTILDAVIDSAQLYGMKQIVFGDGEKNLTYRKLLGGAFAMAGPIGALSAKDSQDDSNSPMQCIGVMLPTSLAAVVTFFATHAIGLTPAMLNFTAGASNVLSACRAAKIRRVLTSRRLAEAARLDEMLAEIRKEGIAVHFLEDLRNELRIADKLRAMLAAIRPRFAWQLVRDEHRVREAVNKEGQADADSVGKTVAKLPPPPLPDPNSAAVVLFTSGSENAPKGVVLSHRNLLANCAQIHCRLDLTPADIILAALPIFHSFGLTGGMLLPLMRGAQTFLYPTPLHYRLIPEIAYATRATVFFSANVFLANYARAAHPYDFQNLRLVVAGAEKLRDETARIWRDKFGVRVLEGYGVTEASPALAFNTPLYHRDGSVGRLLPGIQWKISPVEGIDEGGRLAVAGANIMKGYLLADKPGELIPPPQGWHDTGDIARVDSDDYIFIVGRAKRFAKVSGEMVSLAAVEDAVGILWPDEKHIVVATPDARRGEVIALLTDRENALREDIIAHFKEIKMPEIAIPRRIVYAKEMPLLATGKPDYRAAAELVKRS